MRKKSNTSKDKYIVNTSSYTVYNSQYGREKNPPNYVNNVNI